MDGRQNHGFSKSQRGLPSSAKKNTPLRSTGQRDQRSVSDENETKLKTLQTQFATLQDSVQLSKIKKEMGEMESSLRLLPVEIEKLRTRGYVFRNFLEQKASVMTKQWTDLSPQVSREVVRLTRDLQREASQAEAILHQATRGDTAAVSRAEVAVQALERRIDGAHSAVSGMYKTLRQNVDQTQAQLDELGWLLDQLEQACFQLQPAEDPVAACQAQMMETKKDGPKGVLYLTDERLIFEQRETRATKKMLFVTTQKETVQALIFAIPVGHIEKVEVSQKGFLGHKEMMTLRFTPEADMDTALIRLRGADNDEWASLIGRVRSGDIVKERSQAKDIRVLEALRDVPTTCPTCGAVLDSSIVRGLREIACQYCGTVIRL